ncbi:hypothetical protein HU200_013511 [Digitaria exilis]|uniref:Uncharacterized protein n=1 Tax=Digitaria exilis TaxID=1010633 RepID=A0A835FDK2_9POAL|nr:hypothetical protein HU200_013511 [Digitaria exilis]
MNRPSPVMHRPREKLKVPKPVANFKQPMQEPQICDSKQPAKQASSWQPNNKDRFLDGDLLLFHASAIRKPRGEREGANAWVHKRRCISGEERTVGVDELKAFIGAETIGSTPMAAHTSQRSPSRPGTREGKRKGLQNRPKQRQATETPNAHRPTLPLLFFLPPPPDRRWLSLRRLHSPVRQPISERGAPVPRQTELAWAPVIIAQVIVHQFCTVAPRFAEEDDGDLRLHCAGFDLLKVGVTAGKPELETGAVTEGLDSLQGEKQSSKIRRSCLGELERKSSAALGLGQRSGGPARRSGVALAVSARPCANSIGEPAPALDLVTGINNSSHAGESNGQHPPQAIAVEADVSDAAQVKALFDAAAAAFGSEEVHILVTLAGVQLDFTYPPQAETSEATYDATFGTNAPGHAANRLVRDGRGRIVTFSSSGVGCRCARATRRSSKILVRELHGSGIYHRGGGRAVVAEAPPGRVSLPEGGYRAARRFPCQATLATGSMASSCVAMVAPKLGRRTCNNAVGLDVWM